MPKRVSLLGMSSAALATFKGLTREMIIDTTNNIATVHDGITPGGIPQARADFANVEAATASAAGKMSAAHVTALNTLTADIATLEANAAKRYARYAGFNEGNLLQTRTNGEKVKWEDTAVTEINGDWLPDVGSQTSLVAPYAGVVGVNCLLNFSPVAGVSNPWTEFRLEHNDVAFSAERIYGTGIPSTKVTLNALLNVDIGDVIDVVITLNSITSVEIHTFLTKIVLTKLGDA